MIYKQTFFSSYEEYENGLVTDKDIDRDDLSTYSTSFDIKKSKAKRLLKMFNKNYPKALCILRSLADSDAFQSGRCAEHNGRPETPIIVS